jgi:hypothetical protein
MNVLLVRVLIWCVLSVYTYIGFSYLNYMVIRVGLILIPIRPKHVVKGNVWYICATNCADGNCNKALSYTQYDAEVQHF